MIKLEEILNTVIQGDCLEVMKGFDDKSIDLICCDPPYGIDFQSAWRTEWKRKDKIANDDRPFTDFIPEAYRVLKDTGALLCFTRYDVENEFREKIKEAGFKLRGQIIWDKVIHGMGDLVGDVAPRHENIIFATRGEFTFNGKRPTSVMKFQRVSPEKLTHPNEKPTDLLYHLISHFSKDNEIVLDCFSGSGSTLYSAKQIGRPFIGIELDPKYVEATKQKLRQDILI